MIGEVQPIIVMTAVNIRFRAALLALLVLPPAAAAQPATATLFVQVSDTTGGRLPGVSLSVVNQSTQVQRTATTTPGGAAVVPLLPAGDYVLQARLDGFRALSIDAFHLEAGAAKTFNLTLEPGPVTETVRVTADRVQVRAGSGAVGEVFDSQVLTMTPVASRDVGEYAWQAPGAAPPAPGSRLSGEGGTPVNVAGAREASNNFLLDGVDNNDLYLNRVLVTPSIDAVQEFTLLTNTYDAQYGRSAGAQVNVVSKSGGDRTHGSTYAYFRDRALEARGPFDPPSEPEPFRRRGQAGGTLGGPIAKLVRLLFPQPGRHARSQRRHARRARARRRGTDWRLQRERRRRHRPVHRRSRSRATGFPSRGSTRPAWRWLACTRCRTAPRRRATSSRRPSGRMTCGRLPPATDFHLPKDRTAVPALQLRARRQRRGVSGAGQEPARLRHAHGGQHAESRGRVHANLRRAHVQRSARRLESPAPRRVSGQHGRRRLRAARHDGAIARARRPWLSRDHDDRLRPGGRRRLAAGRARYGHAARHRHGEPRARPALHQGRRRVPALSIGRLQPSVPARTVELPGRVHRQRPCRSAPRAANGHPAGQQRQSAGAQDELVQPVRAGRLAAARSAHHQRRPALRAEHGASRRARSHGRVRRGHGIAGAGGAAGRARAPASPPTG